jgi:predicted PurR-regulated permease PerM
MSHTPVPDDVPDDASPGTFTLPRRAPMSPAQTRTALVAALLLLVGGVLTLHDFLPALIWAVIFAIAIWPHYARFARRWPRHRTALLPAAAVGIVLLGFVVPLVLIAIPLIHDAQSAVDWLAGVQRSGVGTPAWLSHLPFGDTLVTLWQQQLGQPGQLSVLAGRTVQGGVLGIARAIGGQAIHRSMLLGFMLVALFFLLRDGESVAAQLRIGATRAFGPAGENVGRQMILSVHGTVDGLVLVGLGMGVLIGIGYWAAGVPQPVLFGLVTALLAMIPFGAPLCVYVAGAVLVAGGHYVAALALVGWGLGIIFVADHVVRPVLIGGATRLPFVWVLLGVLGGVEAWGLVGLFMGPAIMAALTLLWREWVGVRPGPLNPLAEDVG